MAVLRVINIDFINIDQRSMLCEKINIKNLSEVLICCCVAYFSQSII